MCDCNQGRRPCTCSPDSLMINLVAAVIWLGALIAIAAVLLGVL
jgi:hypothetical protein